MRLTRLSRAGTRASRILRLIRAVQLYRLKKAIAVATASSKATEIKTTSAVKQPRRSVSIHTIASSHQLKQIETAPKQGDPPRVGQKLSDLTTRRVIVIVLLMAVILPLMDQGVYSTTATAEETTLAGLHRQVQLEPLSITFNSSLQAFVKQYSNILRLQLYGLPAESISSITGAPAERFAQSIHMFREFELLEVFDYPCYAANGAELAGSVCTSSAVFNYRSSSQADAMFNLVRTVFVIIVLLIAAFVFTRDAQLLLITPIENMVQSVQLLAENPLAILVDTDEPQVVVQKGAVLP